MGIVNKIKDGLGAEPGNIEDVQATEVLREDHRKVLELFDQFESEEESSAKRRLVEKALIELTVHAKVEEELFYPSARRETDDADLLDEAAEEHHVAKILIAALASMKPSDPRYDAKFTVLAESVRRHIEEEEAELFPKVEQADFDLESLGQQMSERKLQLVEEVTLESIRGEAPSEVEDVVARPAKRSATKRERSGGARSSSRRMGGRSRSRSKAKA